MRALSVSARTWPRILVCAIRVAIGLFFVTAAASKAVDLGAFERLIGDFGIAADAWVGPTAVALVALEALGGIGLVFAARGALAVVTGLLLVFLGALGYGIAIGLDVECGCLGFGGSDAGGTSLASAFVRDVVMLGLTIPLWSERRSLERRATSSRSGSR